MKRENTFRVPLLAGSAAVVVYVVAVVLGGLLRPGYSHISQAVSELIEVGAPNKGILDPLFMAYNVLTAVFAVGVFLARTDRDRGSLAVATAAVLLLEAVVGFVTVFVPEDVPGTAATATGAMHILLASMSSLSTMAAILLVFLWLRNTPGGKGYAVYSLVTLIVVFITGGVAAATTAEGVPINGLAERLTIGAFLQWMFVLGLGLPSPDASARH